MFVNIFLLFIPRERYTHIDLFLRVGWFRGLFFAFVFSPLLPIGSRAGEDSPLPVLFSLLCVINFRFIDYRIFTKKILNFKQCTIETSVTRQVASW